MDYKGFFASALDKLRDERRYRVFADLERIAGRYPHAIWHSPHGQRDVVIWCSNDYLGMAQHPKVIGAMVEAAARMGTGAGGTRNIAGTNHPLVELERELADLHNKPAALVFTSGYVSNETGISTIAGLLPNCLLLSDALNHNSMIEGVRRSGCEKQIWRHNDLGHLEELLKASEELRELSARILQAQDGERRRIARELHDGVGQLLAALSMEASNLASESDRLSSRAGASLKNIESLIAQMNTDIRTMSHLLYPPLLDEVGLQSALKNYVTGFAERSGIHVSLELPAAIERLDRDYELSLFRIVQECLTNIHRHSGSKTASIRIVRNDGALVLEVRDEGRGMPAERLSEIQSRGSGVGIRGMRERTLQLSGTMSIESNGSGTTINVVIPTPKAVSRERTDGDEPVQVLAKSP